MTEFIRYTPESETTPERYFWDNFIRSIGAIAEVSTSEDSHEHDPVDMTDTLTQMQYETEEDALTLLYNYTTQLVVAPGQSSKLEAVESFLASNGFIELE
jgi:hypothetical protein